MMIFLRSTMPTLKSVIALNIEDADVNLSINPTIRAAIWKSCDDLTLDETDIPVASGEAKKIWDKIVPHMPMYALFQSDRSSTDSDSEVQDPMKLAIAAALAEGDIQEKLNEVVEAVRVHATALAMRTHAALAKLDSDLAKQLVPKFKSEPKWGGLFSISLDGDDGIAINKRGSGVRRLVLVSFFRAEAERKIAEGSRQNIIYAIEEPETSQHPRNQKILLDSFKSLAESDGCQVLLTTHSPGLASELDVDGLRFVSKSGGTYPTVNGPGEATWESITDELGVIPDNRVKVLVCVEGVTDVEALRHLSHGLHMGDSSILDLSSDPRIAFVVLGGGALKHWVNQHYLQGLGRPEVHIYDRDVAEYADSIADVNSRVDGSWGVLTQKIEIENYAHPDAIQEGLGFTLSYGDDDDVPALVKAVNGWKPNTTKKRFAAKVFPLMTSERIEAMDPSGEIKDLLARIEKMFS
jgi:putative ATP-dependent endonuclease of OLD family